MNEGSTKKKIGSRPMSKSQSDELAALAALPDHQIDTRDIPEQVDWSGARRGVFSGPVQRRLTLSLDVDVIEWFKAHVAEGEQYQTSINSALRDYVAEHERWSEASGIAKRR